MKHHVVNVKFYISFTRYLHDLKIEHGSRDNTRFQIENSDSPYRDTCHDLKNVVVVAVASGKENTCSMTISTTTLSFQKTTIRLDARHRAKDDAASRSWTCELWDSEGYNLNLTSGWSTRSFPSLFVDLTNVANDRSWTLAETDWSRFIILIMSSLSTLWFYVT